MKKNRWTYMASLAVLIFVFELAVDYMKWADKPAAWGGLVVILLIFNGIWERTHSGAKKAEREEDL